jgi:choline dehydrogenase-like flavoprotein
MFLDARQVAPGSVIETPICIVGSGPAGLTLAWELEAKGQSVCIVESGDYAVEAQIQSLANADQIGLGLLEPHISRMRVYGGASVRWGGICRPLDSDDFAERPWIDKSGWPFKLSDLADAYGRAAAHLGIADKPWDPQTWVSPMDGLLPDVSGDDSFTPANQFRTPHRDIGGLFKPWADQSADTQIFLHGNLKKLETNETASRVERLEIGRLDGSSFFVSPGKTILATGGIENARLLLMTNNVKSAGLGNEHDVLGRYLMSHPQLAAAWLIAEDADASFGESHSRFEIESQRVLLSAAAAELHQVARFSAYIMPMRSLHQHPLNRSAAFKDLSALLGLNPRAPIGASKMALLAKVLRATPEVIVEIGRKIGDRLLRHNSVCVLAENEQVPNPDSRITLSDECDALGMQKARIDWRLLNIDKRTMRRGVELLDEKIRRRGAGKLTFHPWLLDDDVSTFPGEEWAHHLGATRMADDPTQGVVDVNCRVHGVENLFVVGASVFPTAGIAPPTLTIMALAVRLADHLAD